MQKGSIKRRKAQSVASTAPQKLHIELEEKNLLGLQEKIIGYFQYSTEQSQVRLPKKRQYGNRFAFLNSVYAYNDKTVFTCNFQDHAEAVTLDGIEYVFCSDVNNSPPPINPRAVTVLGFLLCKNPSDPTVSLDPFLVGSGCNPALVMLYWTGISS